MNRQSSTSKKRTTLFSALLSLIFIFAMISTMLIIAEAKENPTMTLQVSQESDFAGETVQVKINLVGNPGVASLKINVAYENFLTLQNIEYNPSLGGQASSSNYQQGGSPATLIWVNAFEDFTDDAVFATLTFKISDDAEEDAVSEISVTYDEDDIYDSEEENITLIVKNGSVTVQSSVPGDINGDKKVNNKDITRMFQHLANWGVSVNSSVLDVNGDGKINNKDITRLFQHLANWNVDIYPISYVVTFNGNGGTLVSGKETQTVKKIAINKAASAIAPVYEKDGYAFDCFDKDFFDVTSNLAVTAQWKKTYVQKYKVTFYEYDGSILKIDEVLPGESAQAPLNYYREGYRFENWDALFDNVQSDLDVTAQYIKIYTVKFVDYDGSYFSIDEVDDGSAVTAPEVIPSRANYIFDGWYLDGEKLNNNFSKIVSSDLIIEAKYIRQYTVTFLNYDGTEISKQIVNSGANATYPPHPTREGYSFEEGSDGWDKSILNIQEDTTVRALYEINYYTVRFLTPDNKELKVEKVAWDHYAEAPADYDAVFFNWGNSIVEGYESNTAYGDPEWDKSLDHIRENTDIKLVYRTKITDTVLIIGDYAISQDDISDGKKASAIIYIYSPSETICGLNIELSYEMFNSQGESVNFISLDDSFEDEQLRTKYKNVYNYSGYDKKCSVNIDTNNKTVQFVWSTDGNGNTLNNGNNAILRISFNVEPNTPAGHYIIQLLENSYYIDGSLRKVQPVIISGSIIVR